MIYSAFDPVYFMKIFVFASCFAVGLPCHACAETFTKTARSGQSTIMYVYKSWKIADCTGYSGVVKALSKPQHGKLTPRRVSARIGVSRYLGRTHCLGKAVPGFQVEYTSTPGFHGVDKFTIEVTFGDHAPEVDTFTVNVE